MTEQEMFKKIHDSAESVEIPETLLPKNIKKKLDEQKILQYKAESSTNKNGRQKNLYRGIMVAAVSVIVILTGTMTMFYLNGQWDKQIQIAENNNDASKLEVVLESENTEEDNDFGAGVKKKRDAGEVYVIAENYGEVFDSISAAAMTYGVTEDLEGSIEMVDREDTNEKTEMASSASEKYSGTNLQVQGVDESDITKTDGSYIYTASNNQVFIVDIRENAMQQIAKIEPDTQSGATELVEMYVKGNQLNVIWQSETASLRGEDVYYMNTAVETELVTYDISERSNPKKIGSISQEGYYRSSRKIGDIIYLFTQKDIQIEQSTREEALIDKNVSGWIPLVNGKMVPVDCIYLPNRGRKSLLISSMNVKKPDTVVDQAMIVNNYVEIYVSSDACYLYENNSSMDGQTTQIAKFSLKNGGIDAVDAVSIDGVVKDTFAIHDNNGKLQVLVTKWNEAQVTNSLYLFDEKLKLTGKLEGIADGEEIYAARYLGNIVYFVTYRNTDPLFAVDISDESKPVILSELKITGFSEYLHFWGEDKLLGIGFETDPDSGVIKGIKLVMFDISDPTELKTLGSTVIRNIMHSPALYQYKTALVDETENMIGFAAESYDEEVRKSYLVFEWEDGKFKELLTESLPTQSNVDNCRGMYVNKTFYLVQPESVSSYDREDNYKKLETLNLN